VEIWLVCHFIYLFVARFVFMHTTLTKNRNGNGNQNNETPIAHWSSHYSNLT